MYIAKLLVAWLYIQIDFLIQFDTMRIIHYLHVKGTGIGRVHFAIRHCSHCY